MTKSGVKPEGLEELETSNMRMPSMNAFFIEKMSPPYSHPKYLTVYDKKDDHSQESQNEE